MEFGSSDEGGEGQEEQPLSKEKISPAVPVTNKNESGAKGGGTAEAPRQKGKRKKQGRQGTILAPVVLQVRVGVRGWVGVGVCVGGWVWVGVGGCGCGCGWGCRCRCRCECAWVWVWVWVGEGVCDWVYGG